MTERSTAVEAPPEVRDRLAIVLDVDDAVAAMRLAKEVRPWFGVAKVGLELYSAVGPDVFASLQDLGYDVFADLKFHDIPTTVGRAARVIGALGPRYLNLHALGGPDMLRAGVEGLKAGAAGAGLPEPIALGVTILTTDATADEQELTRRATIARDSGCDGVVCAAADLPLIRRVDPGLVTVVPGIRTAGFEVHDQVRVATPADAIAAGASLLVVGRTVTAADDPTRAAAAVAAEVADALAPGGGAVSSRHRAAQ
ncbi:MAG: orotidine-5'-phosphate decarboxylase [Acidimicrobiia bacterium]